MEKKYSLTLHVKSLWNILNVNEKKKYSLYVFLLIIQALLETLSIGSLYPLLLLIFSNGEILNDNTSQIFNFLKENFLINLNFLSISIIILSLFLIKNFYIISVIHWSRSLERDLRLRLKKNLLSNYINRDYTFHLNRETDKLVRNITLATDKIAASIRNILMLINESLLFIFLIILMASINFKILLYLISIVTIPIFIVGPFLKRTLIKLGGYSFDYEAKSLKRIFQALSMVKEIKIFEKQNFFLKFFSIDERNYQNLERKLFIIKSYPKFAFEIILVIGILTFLNLNFSDMTDTQISEYLPSVAILSVIAMRIFPSLNKIIYILQKYNRYQKTVEEIEKDLAKKINFELINKNKLEEFKEIRLENISFGYEGKEKLVLENFNLDLRKGESLGIIGSSGSGKSTLIDIILGILEPKDGKIKFNNKDIERKNYNWLSLFAYVPQNMSFFDDTIISNITLEDNIDVVDKSKLDFSIKKSGLEKFVNGLEHGLKTNIGELGVRISGGERQRLGIARALYKDSEIIIFDESFNSIDEKTKREIIEDINELFKLKTVINISHEKEDLRYCNRIVEIQIN